MPHPKISGLLHNCSLYAALPTLLEGIQSLAQTNVNELPQGAIIENYQHLKTMFAAFYGINPADLSWTQFNHFLTSHSFYAKEIMFSPILRHFIAERGLQHDYRAGDLWLLRDIQAEGRYNMLTPHDARPLLYHPFGITLEIFEYSQAEAEGKFTPIPHPPHCDQPLTPYPFDHQNRIALYLKDDHFELQEPGADLADATRAFEAEINDLPIELGSIHTRLSTSQTAGETNHALGELFIYVNKTLSIRLYDQSQNLIHADTYAESGRRFHNDTPKGNQTFAVILLILLFEHDNRNAQSFLDLMDWLSHNPLSESISFLDQLASRIIESKANLDDLVDIRTAIEAYQLQTDPSLVKTSTSAMQVELRVAIENLNEAASQIQHPLVVALEPVMNKLHKGNYSQKTLTDFRELKRRIDNEEGDWGKTIGGLMMIVGGLATSILAALWLVGSLGLTAPTTAPMIVAGASLVTTGAVAIYAGFRFFNAAQGLNNVRQPLNEISSTLTPDSLNTTP